MGGARSTNVSDGFRGLFNGIFSIKTTQLRMVDWQLNELERIWKETAVA
jgi:hypothetical protein